MSRILGIVGGTGPQSTIDYYRELVSAWRERGPAGTYPKVIVNSVEGASVIAHLGAGQLTLVAAELSAAVRRRGRVPGCWQPTGRTWRSMRSRQRHRSR